MILHGIKETENNYQELFNIIKETLENLDIAIETYEINNYYRLGRKQNEKKLRLILITFTSQIKKIKILRNKMKMPKHILPKIFRSKRWICVKTYRRNLNKKNKKETAHSFEII